MDRRKFIQQTSIFGIGLTVAPNLIAQGLSDRLQKITILHTNDTHSRIDPFPANNKRYGNKGGVVKRAAIIEQIRQQEEHVLLLDAGDAFQGTPYFNQFNGELEMKVMEQMGYDAMTMGNHDFDIGLSGFYNAYTKNASFPVVCSNYDFSSTILNDITTPHLVIKKGKLRVGIFGLGVELEGLVGKKNYEDTVYLDPIHVAQTKADYLKNEEHCDLVICLSHLGYSYKTNKVSDLIVARSTHNINLIIGGHTHTFLEEPTMVENNRGKQVIVNQVGFGGINLGRIDFYIGKNKIHDNNSLLRIG